MILSPPVPWFSQPEAANSGLWARPRHTYWFTPCLVCLRATMAELSDSRNKNCGLQSLKYILSGPLKKKFARLWSNLLGTSVLFSTDG